MIFISTVLACLLIGGGIGAVVIGSGMIVLERGWSMVISGSIFATGGVLLLGVAMLLRELRRLPERLADALPEWEPGQPVAADNGVAASFEHAGYTRPRVDFPPPPISPSPSVPPPMPSPLPMSDAPTPPVPPAPMAPPGPETPAFLTAEKLPPAAITPQEPLPVIVPVRQETESSAESSALKIQISLHDSGRASPSPPLPPETALIGDAQEIYQEIHQETRQETRKSFWARLGGKGKPKPAEPIGPTAADLARERLALADTPGEADADKEASPDATEPAAADSATHQEKAAPAVTPSREPERKAKEEVSRENHISVEKPAALEKAEDRDEAKTAHDTARDAAPDSNKRATPEPADLPQAAPAPEAPEPASVKQELEADGKTPATETQKEQDEDAIVGSYRAGNNLYVMFASGAIEAETSDGIFRFDTLDNLKKYIASGEAPALRGKPVERPKTEQ